MKLKLFTVLMMGTCLIFLSTVGTYADTSNTNSVNAIMEKQKEIDHAIFEEKKDELAKMGIVVTHTASLENSVEIGIFLIIKKTKIISMRFSERTISRSLRDSKRFY